MTDTSPPPEATVPAEEEEEPATDAAAQPPVAADAAEEKTETTAEEIPETKPVEDNETTAAAATKVDEETNNNHKKKTTHDDDDENKRPKDAETETDASIDDSAAEDKPENTPIVSSNKKSRPPYKYDPNKITLRFLFANRDGLTVTVECNPSDTVGEVKGALISVWPEDVPSCEGGENLRLVCMGKGYLMPDTRTLEDCQIPVFKTHPTPINVSVKPKADNAHEVKNKKSHDRDSGGGGHRHSASSSNPSSNAAQATQGCPCTIL